jgi:hypothetical protein
MFGCGEGLEACIFYSVLTAAFLAYVQVKASYKLSEDFKKGPPKKKPAKKPAAKKVSYTSCSMLLQSPPLAALDCPPMHLCGRQPLTTLSDKNLDSVMMRTESIEGLCRTDYFITFGCEIHHNGDAFLGLDKVTVLCSRSCVLNVHR